MPSIEILVEQPIKKIKDKNIYLFAIDYTCPPKSHRDPSLWQERFLEIGGGLYHMGNPEFKKGKKGWFFAYDLIEEDDLCKNFKFSSKYIKQIMIFLKFLLSCSENKTIHLTTDWQASLNNQYKYKRIFHLSEFIKKHNKEGIRLNSWLTVKDKAEDNPLEFINK